MNVVIFKYVLQTPNNIIKNAWKCKAETKIVVQRMINSYIIYSSVRLCYNLIIVLYITIVCNCQINYLEGKIKTIIKLKNIYSLWINTFVLENYEFWVWSKLLCHFIHICLWRLVIMLWMFLSIISLIGNINK